MCWHMYFNEHVNGGSHAALCVISSHCVASLNIDRLEVGDKEIITILHTVAGESV